MRPFAVTYRLFPKIRPSSEVRSSTVFQDPRNIRPSLTIIPSLSYLFLTGVAHFLKWIYLNLEQWNRYLVCSLDAGWWVSVNMQIGEEASQPRVEMTVPGWTTKDWAANVKWSVQSGEGTRVEAAVPFFQYREGRDEQKMWVTRWEQQVERVIERSCASRRKVHGVVIGGD